VGMTIVEFSNKYDVPYHIVYEATYKVPAVSTMQKDREYPEDDLYREVRNIMNTRLGAHLDKARKLAVFLNNLEGREP